MTVDVNEQADRLLAEALEESGARDPRDFYREQLRELREVNSTGYEAAITYYHETLIPTVAAGDVNPLHAWTEYGRRLAVALAPGETVRIDESGRSHPYESPEEGGLLLHMPSDSGTKALVVGLPPKLSSAQRATYDVLVAGKQKPT
ncbi:MAG: hypothetical protein OXU33_04370 [Gemmatimonadota bacterium]|nr:hypothetical protein [Gemmatimonadota bacterium]MDE3005784.1 hypothetical protein [Gemmatimonadota bacterium]MDE3013286.1 hypothetical protein [Gemmatimonadota bacterium]